MKVLFAYAALVLLLTVAVPGARAANIAVLLSSEAEVYRETLDGFREGVGAGTFTVQTLASDPVGRLDQLRRIRMLVEPDIIFVIGSPALQTVAGKIAHVPIIHAMAFNPPDDAVSGSKNIMGISMIPSVNQTVSLIKDLNPKFRRIGVMYDPDRSEPLFRQAQTALQREKMQLVGRKMRTLADLPAALKSFEKEIDLLWLWPDERFLADAILQRVLLFSFEHKIPVLGLSERHTQMGALLSLSYGSARDMGRQAGETLNRFLNGVTSTLLSHIAPRELKLTVNFKTADKLDVKIPDTIVNRADNVVKAPVYRNGDWWVFRIKSVDTISSKTEVHRVIFTKNKFESDDPSFLTGGDVAGTPHFLPFASVYLNDPRRKWLDFPLIPGKKWSFRYYRATLLNTEKLPLTKMLYSWTNSDAEVIGKAPQLIKTPAGEFEAIEIQRTDFVVGRGALTYYYSPQSQSVVRLEAEFPENSNAHYELELVAYGNGGNMGKDLR